MKHFNFKFTYKSKSCKANGDGSVSAETLELAMIEAQKSVADDFGGSINSVAITSITELKS